LNPAVAAAVREWGRDCHGDHEQAFHVRTLNGARRSGGA
jgi:hypothetical protein